MSQQKIHCKDQCPDCHKDVKPEDQALSCEMCAKWYHISCQGMGKTVYAFLMKKTCQIHWFCKVCDDKAITSLKFIQDVQKDVQNLGTAIAKLNQTNDEILSRLNKLEENDRVNINTGPGDNKVTEIERKLEILEKNQRTCNLVITRLPEVDVGHKIDIKIEENKLVTSILDKLDLVNFVNFEILGRIGTKKDNTKGL